MDFGRSRWRDDAPTRNQCNMNLRRPSMVAFHFVKEPNWPFAPNEKTCKFPKRSARLRCFVLVGDKERQRSERRRVGVCVRRTSEVDFKV